MLAPHFTLLGLDGWEYRLPDSLEGRPALLVFFKTTCATCDLTFPYLNRLREVHRDGWEIWAVSQDVAERSRAYAERFGIPYPVLLDAPAYEVSRLYDPPATPAFYLVAPDGCLEYTTYGFAKEDLNEISRRIATYLDIEPTTIASENDGNPAMKPG